MSTDTNGIQRSQEDVWYLKAIEFGSGPARRTVKIITQNFNGPCSFIAICNILILRGDVEIQPPERDSVSYEFLSQLLGEYLLLHCPDVDISAALSIMPKTTEGMDLNPLFTSSRAFRPAGTGGELKLFSQAGIQLVHGWLVDPDSPEYPAVSKTQDYDTSVTLVASADYLTKGRLVAGYPNGSAEPGVSSHAGPAEGSSSSSSQPIASGSAQAEPTSPGLQLNDEDGEKVRDAIAVRAFLDNTSSQLTYHGLFSLSSLLAPGALVALFRNAHLSVLYKGPAGPSPFTTPAASNPPTPGGASASRHADEDQEGEALYTLVTDYAFLHEPTVVWERLADVEGSAASFVDAEFRTSHPAGGDFAGETGESTLAALERQMADLNVDPADEALAAHLQAEEDAHAQQVWAQREEARQKRQEREQAEQEKKNKKSGLKKKASCIIM